ncbi:MAG: hypothetical protein HOO96_26835 [Polyangiaceae bacterium]|nr:hypothetical protein [Polyangiaceae bacterium]
MRALGISLLVGLATYLSTSLSAAAPRRPRFEPTDLELEEPGEAELDLQLGPAFGESDGGTRLMLPDFELDLGLLPNLEIDIDGAFSLDRVDQAHGRSLGGDALWTSLKLGLYDRHQPGRAFAVGLQLGPRLPVIPGTRGIGYGALALVGFVRGPLHLAFNAGGVVDPGDQAFGKRPVSVVLGASVDIDLDEWDVFSLLVQVGSAIYTSPDPHELSLGAGLSWNVTRKLEVSLLGVAGMFAHTDRATLLLGFSPKVSLF